MTTMICNPRGPAARPGRALARALAALVVGASLLACSSTVVRDAGSGPVAVSTPKYDATATVRRGDTLYGIASSSGITIRDLAAWNGIAPPYIIHPGQRLRLYPDGQARTSSSRAREASTPRRGSARPATGAAKPSSPAAGASVASPANSGLAWRWPTDGQLLNRYVAGDPTKQGIDIAGTGGAPVRAAGDGVVVYSGSGLVGYGELIIIKHNEQWLSAYGHNRNRLVNEGQLVKAGQQIAELGRSGAARDMLHFEIRYNGKPVDPLGHLPRK